jgi:hypothetical protein
MRRLAIFVEGQTERLFLVRLIHEITGDKNISIDEERATRGRQFETINAYRSNDETKYYILLRDCRSDSAVKSCILEAVEKMAKANYERILGVLDVYPKKHNDIPDFDRGLKYKVPTKFIPIKFILAIMETESLKWLRFDGHSEAQRYFGKKECQHEKEAGAV